MAHLGWGPTLGGLLSSLSLKGPPSCMIYISTTSRLIRRLAGCCFSLSRELEDSIAIATAENHTHAHTHTHTSLLCVVFYEGNEAFDAGKVKKKVFFANKVKKGAS